MDGLRLLLCPDKTAETVALLPLEDIIPRYSTSLEIVNIMVVKILTG